MNNQKIFASMIPLNVARKCSLLLLLTALALAGTTTVQAQQEHVLNLQDAEISTLIATVADITGDTFVVDPRVQGKVTVLSSQPMNAQGIYDLFLTALRVQGYAAVKEANTIRILPDVEARQPPQ